MILEFKIPNGDMAIYVERFMAEAGIRKIRKMLALYARSDPDVGQVRAMKDLLRTMARQSKGAERLAKDDFWRADVEVKKWEAAYSQMKALKPSVYPYPARREKWEKELSETRSGLDFSKARRKEAKSSETKARKRWKAYMDALAAAEDVFG